MPTINSGDPLDASTVNSFFNKANKYLNGEMESSDFDSTTAWVEPLHVVQPEFYGAPSPRTELVSGEVHHRKQFNKDYSFICSDDFAKGPLPIPSLSATVYSVDVRVALVHCNFFCFEAHHRYQEVNAPILPSSTGQNNLSDLDMDNDNVLCAYYELYVNDVVILGTIRELYWNFGTLASKNHSISAMVSLLPGVNNICVKVLPVSGSKAKVSAESLSHISIDFYQIVTQTRNMVIDVIHR